MNIINFDEISIKNFKSIGDEVSFNYKDFNGMSFVKGENLDIPELRNGVGKSVIFVDALLMVLFGKIANNVNNRDLFHRKATDNIGWIKLRMEVNMQEWNVHCIMNRSKSGNVSLSADLYEGPVGEETNVSKASKKDTLKFLSEEVIKSDADTFRNAVVLSTSNIQNFFQLPKPAKDAYMDSVFTLAAFGFLYDDIKKATNRLKRDLSSQREIFEGLKTQHKEIVFKSESFIREKEAKIENLNIQIKTKGDEIKALQAKIISVDDVIASIEVLRAQVKDWENEIVDLDVARNGLSEDDGNISELVDQLSEEVNAGLKVKVKEYDEAIGKIKLKIIEVEKIVPLLEKQVADHETEIKKFESEIEDLQAESKRLTKERSDVCNEIVVMTNIKKKFESTYNLLCDECQKKTVDHFEFDQEKYDSLEVSNEKLSKQLEKLGDSSKEPKREIDSIKEIILGINSKLDKALRGVGTFQDQIGELDHDKQIARDIATDLISTKERELYEESRKKYQAAVNKNMASVAAINKSIDETKDEIRKNESMITESKSLDIRISDSAVVLKDLVERVKETQNIENPFDSLVKDGDKKLKVAKETIQDIIKDQRKYELLGNIFDENGVKKHIVANIVASLNILIKKYLAEMGTDYTVIFDDKFQYNFYTSTGECDYWSFSSGERRRLDMAVMLALRDILFTNGLVTNVLIVDEVLDSGIDGFALYAVLNILKNKTKDSNLGCIVISHRTEIQEDLTDTFDRTVLVVKEGGESRIVMHND